MNLSPRAAERLSREAAVQSFDNAARSLNLDWGTGYDGKQVQRWALKLGGRLVGDRQSEVEAYERGDRPSGPANDPPLLVIGVDGGRVQSRQKNPETGSRWREDKVATVTNCLPGDGHDKKPQPLVTTHVATMGDCRAFGKLARVEAERRGIRQARRVLVIGDGGNWIDPLWQKHFPRHQRIVDYYHAVEHLYEASRAVYPGDESQQKRLAEQLKADLWQGRVDAVITRLQEHSQSIGPPQEEDPPGHPRRVLAQNVGYFQRHRGHMDYADYRRRGWPIGSGITESGIKQFNKRVKGTDQFWNEQGAEAILALRGLWLSQDDRWHHYWWYGHLPRKAA